MPPHNAGYMYAAYAAAALIYAGYALSIWWRAQWVAQRLRERTDGQPLDRGS